MAALIPDEKRLVYVGKDMFLRIENAATYYLGLVPPS